MENTEHYAIGIQAQHGTKSCRRYHHESYDRPIIFTNIFTKSLQARINKGFRGGSTPSSPVSTAEPVNPRKPVFSRVCGFFIVIKKVHILASKDHFLDPIFTNFLQKKEAETRPITEYF